MTTILDPGLEETRERDARWAEWVARGRRDDRILRRGAIAAIVVMAGGFVLATVLTFYFR